MGFHYVNRRLLGLTPPSTWVGGRVNGTGTYTGVEPPAILLYIPDADAEDGLRLAGIELLVFAEAWQAANKQPPKYRGREYNYMADNPATPRDEAHNFMPHYAQHIWLFEHKPSGFHSEYTPSGIRRLLAAVWAIFATSKNDAPGAALPLAGGSDRTDAQE